MTKQIFPFFILLHKLHRLILPPLPPRTNSNPSPSALTLRPLTSSHELKPSSPSAHPSAHTSALEPPSVYSPVSDHTQSPVSLRSVRVRAGRVYGCGVLARGQ